MRELFRQVYNAYLNYKHPDKLWRKLVTSNDMPVIRFPTKVVLQEKIEDGDVILEVVQPGTYYVAVAQSVKSLEPRKRNVKEMLEILADFVAMDELTFNDITIEVKFSKELNDRIKEKAVQVVDSKE